MAIRCSLCGFGSCPYHMTLTTCHIPKYEVEDKTKKKPGKTVSGRRSRYKSTFTFKNRTTPNAT